MTALGVPWRGELRLAGAGQAVMLCSAVRKCGDTISYLAMAFLTSAERAALETVDERADEAIATLKAWCRISSGSRNLTGLARMAQALRDAFSRLPGRLEDVALAPSQSIDAHGLRQLQPHPPALRLSVRPDAPLQVALTGHYDTVFPIDSAFQDWRLLSDDVINGPGVADMKGGILVMLEALTALERHPDAARLGYTVLLSPDEEIGSPASAPLLATLGAGAAFGMTYEPALPDGALVGARPGSGNFTLVIHGQAAHAGRAHHLGVSAILAAARFVVALEALNGVQPGVIFNTGKIDGGGPTNIVPDLAVVRFNVRAPDAQARDWAESQIAHCLGQIAGDKLRVELLGSFTRAPKPMAAPIQVLHEIVAEVGHDLGMVLTNRPSGGVCEGNNLWAAGCPNVDTLGVRGGAIHSSEEFAHLSSVAERAKLSALLLMRFASGLYDANQLRPLGQD